MRQLEQEYSEHAEGESENTDVIQILPYSNRFFQQKQGVFWKFPFRKAHAAMTISHNGQV